VSAAREQLVRREQVVGRSKQRDAHAGRLRLHASRCFFSVFAVLYIEVVQYILMKFLILVKLRVDSIPMKSFCEQAMESSDVR
jgi:hypothetical protein